MQRPTPVNICGLIPASISEMTSKQERERRRFIQVCQLMRWQIKGEITQADPPKPDVICEITGLGKVAFELVSIDAEKTHRRINLMLRGHEFWAKAASRLSMPDQERLSELCRRASIHVNFDEELEARQRVAFFRLLQHRLLSALAPLDDGPILAYDELSAWNSPGPGCHRADLYFLYLICPEPLCIVSFGRRLALSADGQDRGEIAH